MDKTATHRAQIIFRKAQVQSREEGGSRSSLGTQPTPWTCYLAVGCVETDGGALPDETVLGFVMGDRHQGMKISLGVAQPQERADEIAMCDVNGVLRSMEVRSPQGFSAMLSHGGLHLRKSRFPSPEGRETMIVAGILRSGPDLPEKTLFEMEGNGNELRTVRMRPVALSFAQGSTPSQTLELPIWGFGPEPLNFRSSLSLSIIDEMKEYAALQTIALPSKAQTERLEGLKRSAGFDVLRGGDKDVEYRRWKEIGRELGTPFDLPPDSYMTAATISQVEETSALAAKMLYEETNASSSYGR